MEPYAGFEAFVAAYEAGSITGGAQDLGVPRATLSRQLARLESRLGVRLVHRDARRFHATEAGRELYERAREIVDSSRAAVEALRRVDGVPQGLLRLAIPPTTSLDPYRIDQALITFAATWPAIHLEIHAGPSYVDLLAGRFDVALRAGASDAQDADLIQRTVFHVDLAAVAAPEYVARHGTPNAVEELENHRVVVGFERGSRPNSRWPLRKGGDVKVTPSFATNDLTLAREAALAGVGIALLPDIVCGADLTAGRLVPLLAGVVGARNRQSIVYPSRSYVSPKVRTFVDHIVAWVEAKRRALEP
ncbi:MAG: LysR family transcriptional regulator [Myxococcota bacterium]